MEIVLTHLQALEKKAHFTNDGVKSNYDCDMILNLSVTLNSILRRHSNFISHTYCYGVACLLETPHSGEKFWVYMSAVSDG